MVDLIRSKAILPDPFSSLKLFKAQVDARKLIQYLLLADWRRLGKATNHAVVSLSNTVRPELDQADATLIVELADKVFVLKSYASN